MAKRNRRLARASSQQALMCYSKIALTVALLFNASLLQATTEEYAPWLTQIGLNQTILSNAKWGHGIKLGIVDTGITNNANYFTKGQLSNNLSGCAAVTFTCVNGFADELGHGTAVAAVASGNQTIQSLSSVAGYNVLPGSVMSVAPSSNLISIKVFDKDHPTTPFTNVANGIVKATDAGAQVINVSISYGNESEIVNAINYAASKGTFIVWSAGNDSDKINAEVDTLGLTPEAVKRFVFAGSVNYANVKSDFSNEPGTGGMNALGVITPYAYRTVYAPGEGVLAPDITNSAPVFFKYWDGTSFSAPIVSASLGLLINTWPILRTQGTAADLLLATATNLGASGVDAIYGSGLVNLNKAFQPYGDVTMKGAKGNVYIASELTGSLVTSGALGKLSKIKKKLKNYNGFDEFNRNFKYNLSNMVTSGGARPVVNPLPTFKKKKAKKLKFTDTFTQDETILTYLSSDHENPIEHLGEFGYNPETDTSQQAGYMALETSDGNFFAYGYDYSADLAFQQALYGDEFAINNTNFSESLSRLAEGGKLFALGWQFAPNTRLAMTWNTTENDLTVNPWLQNSEATSIKFGMSHQFNASFAGAISLSSLNENNGLLGSQYQSNALLSFNPQNQSQSIDISAVYKLNQNNDLAFEATYAKTRAAEANGLIRGTTDIASYAFGASWISKSFYQKDDQLTLSIKQPLRVNSGKTGLIVAGVDALGYATYTTEWLDIKPEGREIDYMLMYETPLPKNQYLSFQAGYRQDLLNEKGVNDLGIGVNYRKDF